MENNLTEWVSSVHFIHSVVSDSLRPHGLQHIRPPCPSPTPGAYPNSLSIESEMPSNHLILCHPLLLLPSVFPTIRVFSNESAHLSGLSEWAQCNLKNPVEEGCRGTGVRRGDDTGSMKNGDVTKKWVVRVEKACHEPRNNRQPLETLKTGKELFPRISRRNSALQKPWLYLTEINLELLTSKTVKHKFLLF